ncbi:MAG: hypothetical protein FWD42_01950 [Solirubrobacterales bacterium]|nr:hypothetical protein [Solirubrobacterales bacterium]
MAPAARHISTVILSLAALAGAGCGAASGPATSGSAQAVHGAPGAARAGAARGQRSTTPASSAAASTSTTTASAPTSTATTASATASVTAASAAPSPPRVSAPGRLGAGWSTAASVGGDAVAWAAQRGGVTLMRFDQRVLHLVLHAGTAEPVGVGCPHGCDIAAAERRRVVAGFNGGFKLSLGAGVGFMDGGRVAVPLSSGLASIVTYRDGATQIGAWREGVPVRGHGGVSSVLQNLHPLIAGGRRAPTLESCAIECWGATLGGGVVVARSALGTTGNGQLVWAGGESLSPSAIAGALRGAGARDAVELDINPEWVAGYLYERHPGGLTAAPMVPGQPGIPGQLLSPDSRDFFTVAAAR